MASHGKENEINIKMTYTQISQQNIKKSVIGVYDIEETVH